MRKDELDYTWFTVVRWKLILSILLVWNLFVLATIVIEGYPLRSAIGGFFVGVILAALVMEIIDPLQRKNNAKG